MMIPMINEVARCLEEGIVASPAEADMALVYGLGFPPFHGGACRYLDTLGSGRYVEMAQQLAHLGAIYQVPDGLQQKPEAMKAITHRSRHTRTFPTDNRHEGRKYGKGSDC